MALSAKTAFIASIASSAWSSNLRLIGPRKLRRPQEDATNQTGIQLERRLERHWAEFNVTRSPSSILDASFRRQPDLLGAIAPAAAPPGAPAPPPRRHRAGDRRRHLGRPAPARGPVEWHRPGSDPGGIVECRGKRAGPSRHPRRRAGWSGLDPHLPRVEPPPRHRTRRVGIAGPALGRDPGRTTPPEPSSGAPGRDSAASGKREDS
jgi:hypothetical protein